MAGPSLRSAHFYRKVPKELTEGTALGGVVSLVGIVVSILLVYYNAVEYFQTSVRTKLVLDLNTEDHIELAFNITMDGLPCRFTSIDFFDETGTKRLNITQDVTKLRVSSHDGHILGSGDEEEWTKDVEHDDEEEVTELAALIHHESDGEVPTEVPMVTEAGFDEFVKARDIVMVAYGAPWCPWSRRMEPVWKALFMTVHSSPMEELVSLGRVDCTVEKNLCSKQQVSAFPTLRVYRQHDTHSHENYHGDRTVEALHEFLQESIESHEDAAGFHPLTHLTHHAGEGCQVSGGVLISRVPGSLRISAQSPQRARGWHSSAHSFDPLMMNATHHVDALLFVPPRYKQQRGSEIEWDAQLHSHSLGAITDPGELRLRSTTFVMHEQATTLKHYLKVVPQRRFALNGKVSDTFQYSTNYNEFHPGDLKPHAADPMQRLVPNAVFTYGISPYRVVHREESESLGTFITQLCAIVGGVFTVFGLIDGVIYHGAKAIKQD